MEATPSGCGGNTQMGWELRHMFVMLRSRTGKEGRCLEVIGPGCLYLTGKPCKLTENSWQNSLTCGNFCAILG